MQATTNVFVKDSSRNNRRKTSRSSKAMEAMNIPEELVDLIRDTEEQKNYSGGLFAILVICLLLGLIGLVTYFTMPDSGPKDNLKPISFKDIFTIASVTADFKYAWKDGHLVFRNGSGHYYSIKLSRNITQPSIILQKQHYVKGMSVSYDLTVWLIPVNSRQNEYLEEEYSYKLYRPSRNFPYYRSIIVGNDSISYLADISWGPRSKYMVAVYKRNIYYSLNPLESASFICITCRLNQSRIYGRFLGYYKDEIFNRNKPFWWNNNGQFLTFLSFADDQVKLVNVEVFDLPSLYPQYHNISYSKAGLSISIYKVEVHVFNIASQKLYSFNMNNYSPYRPYYIINIQWYNGSYLLVSNMSSDQSRVTVMLCEVIKLDCFTLLDRTSTRWISMDEYKTVLVDNDNGYIYVSLTVNGDTKLQKHICRITVQRHSPNRITWLNLSSYNIIRLYSFDSMSKSLYFLASPINHNSTHLYKVNVVTEMVSCASCQFTSCFNSEAYFSGMRTVFVHRCLGPGPESYQLVNALDRGYQTIVLENNTRLRNYIANKSLPRIEYSIINVTQQRRKFRVNAKIFYPRNLNPNHVILYQAIVILPESPQKSITNYNFEVGWVSYVTSYLQYVVIKLDIRGTDDKEPFLPMSNLWGLKNGYVNILLAALKDIVLRRPYIDNSSVGVIGENYGGYLAGKLMTEENIFPNIRCGVSVSPIVDYALYDSFFSERHLGQYNRHRTQYENSRLQASTMLRKKELLLIHYENKNHVLFDQSARFIKDLVDQDIVFDLVLMYQGRNGNYREWDHNKYALKKISKFFVNCFNRSSVKYSMLENDTMNSFL